MHVWWRWVVVVVAGLGVVLVEVEVDEDAMAEAPPSTAAVTAGREREPLNLGDGVGVRRPSPERQVSGVLLAKRPLLDVVKRASTADEEGGDVVVPAVERDTFQAEANMVELVFVVCMSLEPPLAHVDAVAGAPKVAAGHGVGAVVLVHEANKELLGVVLDHLDVGQSCAQLRGELSRHLLAGDVLPRPIEPCDGTVGGEDGCLGLHLRRRRDNHEVLLRPERRVAKAWHLGVVTAWHRGWAGVKLQQGRRARDLPAPARTRRHL